jgi:hypothetical protein
MRPFGCAALVVALVVGLCFGFFGVSPDTGGGEPGFKAAITIFSGLGCVLLVLIFGRVTNRRDGSVGIGARLGIWVPVVAGMGFFGAWTEGLGTQVIVGIVGAFVGLILPSAIEHGGSSVGPPDGGGSDGGGS